MDILINEFPVVVIAAPMMNSPLMHRVTVVIIPAVPSTQT
jgi:hypothetical protein